MKTMIAHNPYLIVRIVTSLILQVLLVILLRWPHQDSTTFSICIFIVAVLALVPL
jgi:hypothetical protein